MEKGTTHVGMDVHKRSIALAMRGPEGAVSGRTIPNEPKAVWGRKNWTLAHQQWLRGLRLEHPAEQATFDAYCTALDQAQERLRAIGADLETWASQEPYAAPVRWLRCFHGIDTTTAMTLVIELHDFRRFRRPRELMAYLGLVPSEHSSGDRTMRGGITKAANGHARRVLVECAWHYRHPARVSAVLRKRREGQLARVTTIADRAHQRLSRRYRGIAARGKPYNKIVVAIARELVGFLWATLAAIWGGAEPSSPSVVDRVAVIERTRKGS